MSEQAPERSRIAAVLSGGRQGSGYAISSGLVLTAAHVLKDIDDVRVAFPGQTAQMRCRVVWMRHDERCDAALISPQDGSFNHGPLPQSVSFAIVRDSLEPIVNCQTIGYPSVQRNSSDDLDTEQFIGTLKPGAKMLSARYVLDSSYHPPAENMDGTSPWAGFSGAAVFTQDAIVGVVAHDPSGWQHGRLEVTSVGVLEADLGFRECLDREGVQIRLFESSDNRSSQFAIFEQRYRDYIVSKYGTLTIFGIDLSDRSNAEWPLDAAYLSLEAVGAEETARNGKNDGLAAQKTSQVKPADQALAGHHQVLLRGVAGSGKTTLVQWLAVSAAKQQLGENLRHLYNRVPIVLPLRTLIRYGELPVPSDFLAAVRNPLAGIQPKGWTENILSHKRGLLLVDGIDEISERDRERVRGWLRDLMLVFPQNMWLVTSRPSAVTDDWLATEGFFELSLSAMGRSDIAAFIERWHAAAISMCQDEEEVRRLETYRSALMNAVRAKQDLGRLATNPLMCGLICALHRDRRGYLPEGRKQLYDAALSMLLARRDRERDLDVRLSEEPQIQLLQKLAYWLIKNGQVEMDRSDAIDLINAALPAIPSIADLGTPGQVYDYMLLRSGIIREPVPGVMDFIHRTFQDYLGAKAAVEERDFDLMVRNAHHDQWEDVIRMAVAHAYPAERARILHKLLKRGDRVKTHRTRLHLLAMACLEHATELDVGVRREVEERAATLIPPDNHQSAQALALAGPMVLDLLPGPDSITEAQARAVVNTAALIPSDAAVPVLARYRAYPDGSIQETLLSTWRNFDTRQYGREVVAYLPKDVMFWLESIDQLEFLNEVGGREHVIFRGSCTADRLANAMADGGPTVLGLHDNHKIDKLGGVPLSRLKTLYLARCPQIRDLSPLKEFGRLEHLSLNSMTGLPDLRGLNTLDGLASLKVLQPVSQGDLSVLPKSGNLKSLALYSEAVESTGLRGLRGLRGLEALTVRLDDFKSEDVIDWGEIYSHPELCRLRLDPQGFEAILKCGQTFGNIVTLSMEFIPTRTPEPLVRQVVDAFPRLRYISGHWSEEFRQELGEILPDVKVKFLQSGSTDDDF
ncbi:NACHT domain-containing protein [Streptomyces sp. NPDC056242]|uniref:NACHT domain-containing protein n=1 Tax=Streptomyces sp. NPDC056242 TaxID=3345760 RepID=UPI0035DADA27